ncbi:hypothetical protein [Clostridium sp.]|uniref:hypothetical protein n=1 Tax=Clostridium sp. TaxID=1506 RepID=UPI00262593B2|nr:hypothetical protein [Clostridium sp.]
MNIEEENIEEIFKQIDNIIFFQRSIGKYKVNLFPRIRCTIGKEIDNFYGQALLIKRYLNNIRNKEDLQELDKYILENGTGLIDKVYNAINYIQDNGYKSIIKRSMNNYEVCLGKTDGGNLTVSEDGEIKVTTIKYLNYNLKENDIYLYLKKIKRRQMLRNIEDVIDYYIVKENLTEDSREYLKGMLSIPNEELKFLERAILGKIKISEKKFSEEINRVIKMDSKCLTNYRRI